MTVARTERPVLLVVANGVDAEAIQELFARRGFVVTVTSSPAALTRYLASDSTPPTVALIDLAHASASRALRLLRAQKRPAIVVGIAPDDVVLALQDELDAAFARPIDRARIFVKVVELVARRRHGHDAKRITGVVAVVRGNRLFQGVQAMLHAIVHPVNAGAILEGVVRELGTTPGQLSLADVEAMLVSGRLAGALAAFADTPALAAAMGRLRRLLETPASAGAGCRLPQGRGASAAG